MSKNPSMAPVRRAALAAMVFLGTYYVTAIPALMFFGVDGPTLLIPFVVSVVAARYAWMRADSLPKHVAACTFSGALLFGAIGFVAGFLGPLIFMPEANQGPLLGIFVTGPAGVLLGAVAGLVYGLARSRRESGTVASGSAEL